MTSNLGRLWLALCLLAAFTARPAQGQEKERKGFGSPEEAKEESSGGFGSSRKKKADDDDGDDKKESKGRSSRKKRVRKSKEEILRDKQLRAISKKLGRKQDGFFAMEFYERKWEAPPANAKNIRPGTRWIPKDSTELLVLETRDRAAEYVLKWMTEHAPKEEKSRSSRNKEESKSEGPQTPPIARDWRPLKWFKTNQEASAFEEYYRQAKAASKAKRK